MKSLVFVMILWVVYLGLRTWVNRGESNRRRKSWNDSGHTSGSSDSHASSYGARDSDGDCSGDNANSSGDAGGGSSSD